MAKFSIFGQEFYIRMLPTFPGAKAGIPCKMPSTARNPTPGQRKARAWLGVTAHGLLNTWGAVSDAGKGKGGTALGKKVHDARPGIGAHVAEWKTAHHGAIRKRRTAADIEALKAAAA